MSQERKIIAEYVAQYPDLRVESKALLESYSDVLKILEKKHLSVEESTEVYEKYVSNVKVTSPTSRKNFWPDHECWLNFSVAKVYKNLVNCLQ